MRGKESGKYHLILYKELSIGIGEVMVMLQNIALMPLKNVLTLVGVS